MRTRGSDGAAELAARGWQRWWSRWVDRRRGGPGPRQARRALAALLVVAGGVLAVLPARAAGGVTVAMTVDDVAVGSVLGAAQVRTEFVTAVPDGALTPSEAVGRVLAGPVRRGEILTDARLVAVDGPDPGAGRVAVPVRLDDPGVVALLRPGLHVAVLAVRDESGTVAAEPGAADPVAGSAADDGAGLVTVLAEDAVVLSVPAAKESTAVRSAVGAGTILLAVPTAAADGVAAHAVLGSLTVRFT